MGQVLWYGAVWAMVAAFLVVPGYVLARAAAPGLTPLTAIAVAPVAAMGFAGAAAGVSLLVPWSIVTVATAAVATLTTTVAVVGWRTRRRLRPDRPALQAVGVWALLFALVSAFVALPTAVPSDLSTYSIPAERVETPRVPGLPSDSHLPYRTGQLVIHEQGGEALRDDYHPGWWISDRGPLVGLVFAFGAGALRVEVPAVDPITVSSDANVMTFMDPYGYWLYLMIAAALSTVAVLGVHAIGVSWFGRRAALFGSLLFALLPGVFVYAVYPRPALVQVLPALLALVLVTERRYWWAGIAIGVCALAHPTGAVWGVAAVALAWSTLRSVRALVPVAARMVVPALVLYAPWTAFTALVVKGSSRMTVWPLGAKLSDPTQPLDGVTEAWQALVARGLWEVPWVRAVALVRSVVPAELYLLPDEFQRGWIGLHSLAAWGLIGVVAFPLAVVGVIKLTDENRTRIVVVGGVVVGLNLVVEGFPESFFPQSLFPLAGLLVLALAAWSRRWRPRWRVLLVVVVATEVAVLVWFSTLYDPFGTASDVVAVLTLVAASAQVVLVAWAIKVAIEPPSDAAERGPTRPSPTRTGGTVQPADPSLPDAARGPSEPAAPAG